MSARLAFPQAVIRVNIDRAGFENPHGDDVRRVRLQGDEDRALDQGRFAPASKMAR
jgi:hypothetical protein